MRVSNISFAAALLLALPTLAGANLAGAKNPPANRSALCLASDPDRQTADCDSTADADDEIAAARNLGRLASVTEYRDDALTSFVRLELENLGVERPSDRSNSDLERVIARYSETIMLDPKDDDAYFRRGIANFYAGSVPKALSDISRASELDPDYPYYPLWLHIVAQRGRLPSRLAETVAHIDMTKWPAPIIRLFLGQTTREAVLAAAADPDAQKRREQLCEAHFYVGQIELQQTKLNEATQLFRLAANDCPRDFVEAPAAGAELTALAGRH